MEFGIFYQLPCVEGQKPHPPVYIASNSPDTFPIVGSLGHNILVAPVISQDGAVTGVAAYRRALTENGHDVDSVRVNVNVPVFVGEDRKTAGKGLEASINNYLNSLREIGRSRVAQRAASLDYQRISKEYGVIGDPDQCVEKLELFRDRFGAQEFMCWFNIGGLLTHQEVAKSMRLFATEVMPHFRG